MQRLIGAVTVCLLVTTGAIACEGSKDSLSSQPEATPANRVERYEDLPRVEEGGEFTDIDQWATVLEERGIKCEIQYKTGNGGQCLIGGKPANLFIGDAPLPVDDLVKAGVDAFVAGWNWRLDTGFNEIAKRVHKALPGTRFITY